MVRERRIRGFLTIALVTFMVVTQAICVVTATFAEDRDKEIQPTVLTLETTENQVYKKEFIELLANQYHVDVNYLNYIAEVEKTFDLEPYELFALISQESNFIPQTKMDEGTLSYNTTQMKLATAKTAYMAITEYYKKEISYPTHELLKDDKYYATMLAGGYLKYLHDTYNNKYESYTAYRCGISGRLEFYNKNGNYKSSYALKIAELSSAFAKGETKI
ncbi:MAG: transglycosylase SLT domain-containing protein [Eubacteriales bacterium]